jgi:hypothetical protein
MDYIYWSTLARLGPQVGTVISYDIVCQWTKNLLARRDDMPDHIVAEVPVLPDGDVCYVIPKYHWRAHTEKDHNKYSLNLIPGVGRTDGEQIERGWSTHDAVSASVREMGPGSRHDTLEDHFGWNNWLKLLGLGKRSLVGYIPQANILFRQAAVAAPL